LIKAGTAGGARVIQNLKSVSYKAGNSTLTFFDHGLENFGFSTMAQVFWVELCGGAFVGHGTAPEAMQD